jgi:hypothetical protein
MNEHGVETVDQAFFVLEAVQFKRPEDVNALRVQIEALNVNPAMLFIDTFARSAVGIDENDAMGVGLWIDAVTGLQQSMAVDVVAIHHAQKAPKDDKRGATVRERGSSAFIGAVDTVIRLTKDGHTVEVTCDKQKDAEHFAPFTLAIKVVPLGMDEHRAPVSSCVLVDPEDPDVATSPISSDLLVMLSTLNAFPEATAERREWWPKTNLTERTFDRHRNELVTGNYVEPTTRGVFKLTDEGRRAIANELPPISHGGISQSVVAATYPPPEGGEMATTRLTDHKQGDCSDLDASPTPGRDDAPTGNGHDGTGGIVRDGVVNPGEPLTTKVR